MKTNFFNQHWRSGEHSERKIVWIELWLIPSAALTFEEKIQQSLFLFFFFVHLISHSFYNSLPSRVLIFFKEIPDALLRSSHENDFCGRQNYTFRIVWGLLSVGFGGAKKKRVLKM